jgi:3-phosphoshikimate 1-carboxyvinyltransferase
MTEARPRRRSKLLVRPQKRPLSGTVSVPADKSISHRAVMLGALADGRSLIDNWLPAGDTLATLGAFEALGIAIEVERRSEQAWRLAIEGRGLHGLRRPQAAIDCRNAGTCMRLLAGILAGQTFASLLDGSEQLRRRPMRRICRPLRQMGARIEDRDGRAPLVIQPAPLQGMEYRLEVASAQVKSAILLAGLYAAGESRLFQPGPGRDHTERMLQAMGAPLAVEPAADGGGWITLAGPVTGLQPLQLTVPADISSAAFPLVAAAVVPHSRITLTGVGINETRTGILDLLAAMGAPFTLDGQQTSGGEPAANVTIGFDELHATAAAGELVVRAIDEFPAWAVAASQAAGKSSVRDAAELRVKEVDRIGVLAGELRKMGAAVDEHTDGFSVTGPTRLKGAEVDSHGDHRLGMALAIAGLVADSPTLVHDAGCIADSFPGFVETMQALGAEMEWIE